MANFKNEDEFSKWLDARPKATRGAEARVLGLRSALRVAPLMASVFRGQHNPSTRRDIFASYFRRLSSTAAISLAPAAVDELRSYAASASRAFSAALSARSAAFSAARSAAFSAATASAGRSAAASSAASAAARSASAASAARSAAAAAAMRAELSRDANLLEAGTAPAELARLPLWQDGAPEWAAKGMDELERGLIAIGEDWDVWTRWHRARFTGAPVDEVLEIRRAKIEPEDWDKGPAHVNALIKRMEEDRARELAEVARAAKPPLREPAKAGGTSEAAAAPKPEKRTDSIIKTRVEAEVKWDFFVSYSAPDEAMAREVINVLEGAGKSTFSMLNDMPVGSNFITEMQTGLAGGGRLVALYSPAYVKSDHCQNEWNAAYLADPSGARRKLVGLMIEPAELLPLARSIVFKQLVGLGEGERKAAILAAIAPSRPKRDLAETKAALAAVSPRTTLTADGKLDLAANPATDTPVSTRNLAALPMDQQELIKPLINSLPRNTPLAVVNGLTTYEEHLARNGRNLRPQFLTMMSAGIEAEYHAAGADLWGKGLESWFGAFFKNHDLIKTHYPLPDEPLYADTPVDEDKAMGDAITEPIKTVEDAVKGLSAENLATDRLAHEIGQYAQQARDIAHLRPDENAGQAGSTRVSIKRRYVLATLGMLVGMYNFVGSTASIISTPAGAEFFKALGTAIEMLSKLLL